MNKRLSAIASMVQNGRGLIDVGTDHGYLPVGWRNPAIAAHFLPPTSTKGR
jgi:tRNA A22 N-methylase